MMAISLYTSRCILNILGVDNYGIYNIIGGVVVLFSFITNSMTNSTQRFFNYYVGVGDNKNLELVFGTARVAHLIILVIFFFISETFGLWFIDNYLNIPPDRVNAARWVYQISVISSLFGIVIIPYRAAIIAKEKMGIFAYTSIIEVILKLVIVLILPLFKYDYLILYSILYASVSLMSFFGHKIICKYFLNFTARKFQWNKQQLKEMMSFSWWYLIGGAAMVGSKQGMNILINIFFNVVLNAAVGIANQVSNAIYNFVTNFQTAFNPRLVILYAKNDIISLISLIFKSSKFSVYLLLIIALPVLINCQQILEIWLNDVPPYSSSFTQLVIITSFFDALSAPLWVTVGATGNVKNYQIFVSLILLMSLPVSYVVLSSGWSPIFVFIICLGTNGSAYIFRLLYLRRFISFSIIKYLHNVILPCLKICILSAVVALIIKRMFIHIPLGINICAIVFLTSIIILQFGLNRNEKGFVKDIFVKALNSFNN